MCPNLSRLIAILLALTLVAGCSTDDPMGDNNGSGDASGADAADVQDDSGRSDADAGSDSSSTDAGDTARDADDADEVSEDTTDDTIDDASDSADSCSGESNDELCTAEQAECGDVTVTDSCGENRNVYCGGCGAGEACVQGTCQCEPVKCTDIITSCGIVDDGCGGEIVCAEGCPTALSLGGHHTCVKDSQGGVRCWGRNHQGQLGDGTKTDRGVPTPVSGITQKIDSLATGEKHTCARINSKVYCWGDGKHQLFGSSESDQTSPYEITGFGGLVGYLGAGNFHNCATFELGGLKCWGRGDWGQLGDGNTWYSDGDGTGTPVDVDFSNVTAGRIVETDAGPLFTCAIDENGAAFCWGENTFGQVGTGQQADDPTTPRKVQITGQVADIAAGGWYGSGSGTGYTITGWTCGVMSSGDVKCWGSNRVGQLGIGNSSTNYSELPADVTGLSTKVASVTAGGDHACALDQNGDVYCWGYNGSGQVGDGTTTDAYAPVKVALPGPADIVVAGSFHTCAVLESGEMYCWGDNEYDQIGSQFGATETTPVRVFPQ